MCLKHWVSSYLSFIYPFLWLIYSSLSPYGYGFIFLLIKGFFRYLLHCWFWYRGCDEFLTMCLQWNALISLLFWKIIMLFLLILVNSLFTLVIIRKGIFPLIYFNIVYLYFGYLNCNLLWRLSSLTIPTKDSQCLLYLPVHLYSLIWGTFCNNWVDIFSFKILFI